MFKLFTKKRRNGRAPFRRNFAAGDTGRLVSDWFTDDLTADQAVFNRSRNLRNRARDLERNNGYTRRFIHMAKSNIVGPKGIRLKSQPRDDNGMVDEPARRMIEAAWAAWGRVGTCTMSGRLSWHDVQNMAVARMLVDGEVFLRLFPAADNRYGFAVEFIPAEVCDLNLSRQRANGRNEIKMGVEVNAFNRPVAYHFFRDPESTISTGKTMRIPAEQIIHLYIQERPHQTRGFTWLCSSMLRQRMLDGYEHAVVVGARVAASKMGFLIPGEEYQGEGVDADGRKIMSAEPGEFEELPRGMSVDTFDPDYPPASFGEFSKEIKRSIASGYNVSYNTLANDLEGVNYSSIRHGNLEDRDMWRCFHTYFIDHLHRPMFSEWVKWVLTTQAVPLPVRNLNKFSQARWQPRGWTWVDPLKEINAAKIAHDNGMKPLELILAEQGLDLEDVLEMYEREHDLVKLHNLDFPLDKDPNDGPEDTEPDTED